MREVSIENDKYQIGFKQYLFQAPHYKTPRI